MAQQEVQVEPLREQERDADPELAQAIRQQKIWLARIAYEREAHRDYRKQAKNADKVFRNDCGDELYVPLYWSVVNVQHVGVYSNQPQPDIRPAFEGNTEIFKNVARVMERGCRNVIDDRKFDLNAHRAVDDYLACGLGILRAKTSTELAGPMQIGRQQITWEHVGFDHFLWEPCNGYEQCSWVGFRHSMTKREIRKRFKRDVKAGKTDQNKDGVSEWQRKTHDIYEIWDKDSGKVYFIAEGENTPLEVAEDPFRLTNFFPCVVMWGTLVSGELIPIPDYVYIEPYDTELNRLQERRMGLMEQLRASGAYDKGMPELRDMFQNEDGVYTGIDNLLGRINAAGGLEGFIYHLPIAEKAEVLRQLTEQMQVVKAQVDEMLGISDIVRGVTRASESATAQEIKGRWVGVRLTRKRETVQYAMREVMRITCEILINIVTPENLTLMTQVPITGEMYNLMQQKGATHFAIDVETESTVARDEEAERTAYQEMMVGVAQFAQSVLPAVQQGSLSADVSSAILRTALRPYAKFDRSLDDSLKTLPNTQQQLQQLQQQFQQATMQNQQLQQQLQRAIQQLTLLQNQATEAKAAREMADAENKRAQAQKSLIEIQNERVEPLKTVAETRKIDAETQAINRGGNENG